MNATRKTLIVVLGGMTVMVVTVISGAAAGFAVAVDHDAGAYGLNWLASVFWGGVIGAVFGGLLWGLLGYMVCRNKNAAPNGVIPDDSATLNTAGK